MEEAPSEEVVKKCLVLRSGRLVAMLASKHAHSRDCRIRFEEEGHKYFIDGQLASSLGYISTTTLIHKLFPRFDADAIIAKMRNSLSWGDSKYYGLTDQEIKGLWNKNGSDAASAGTEMHSNLEMWGNGLPHNTESKEFRLFSRFRDDNPDLKPFRSEWLIFDEESKISGSVDMIYKNDSGEFLMCDYKRSKEIRLFNKLQKGCSPVTSDLDDCNLNHYSLQLGIYKAILEKNYGIEISKTFLLVLHPNQDTYLKVPTKDMSEKVTEILASRSISA